MPRSERSVDENYVMAWPSSAIPKRGTPAVGADYSMDVHPSSSPSCPRGSVAADFTYPFELLSSSPAAHIRRRAGARMATRAVGIDDGAAWPSSPSPTETALDASFLYDWPSSLPVRAARPRVTDESYVYEWPSSEPRCSKPCPTHVMTWAPVR
jgi:hypothetical protein